MRAQLASMLAHCSGAGVCGNNCGINAHVPPLFSRRMTLDQRKPSAVDITAGERIFRCPSAVSATYDAFVLTNLNGRN